MSQQQPSLTALLLPPVSSSSTPTATATASHKAFHKATRATFLERAGAGTLSKETLQQWLSQDRLYARAYLVFVSGLVGVVGGALGGASGGEIGEERVEDEIMDLLISALVNIRRELKFFEDVASRYGLHIHPHVTPYIAPPPHVGSHLEGSGKAHASRIEISEGVQLYKDLFEGVLLAIEDEESEVGVLEGLVLLWGTEKCYLEAWQYAATFQPQPSSSSSSAPKDDSDGGALRKEFIPNWTSPEFIQFVEQIEHLTNKLWQGDDGAEERRVLKKSGVVVRGKKTREQRLRYIEGIWKKVLEAEERFWPGVRTL